MVVTAENLSLLCKCWMHNILDKNLQCILSIDDKWNYTLPWLMLRIIEKNVVDQNGTVVVDVKLYDDDFYSC